MNEKFDATWIWPNGSVVHGRMVGDSFWFADARGSASIQALHLPAEEGFRWLRGHHTENSPEVQAAMARRIIGRSE